MQVSTILPAKQTRPKPSSQAGRILHLLESARGASVSLNDLLALRISQYGARIHELRHKYGFRIENGTEPGRSDHTWFRLITKQPQSPPSVNDNVGLLFSELAEPHCNRTGGTMRMSCPHCGKPIAIVKAAESAPAIPERFPNEEAKSAPQLKLVTCNRCGQGDLCWQESKNGKFYLCKARVESGGKVIPLRKEFHVCQ